MSNVVEEVKLFTVGMSFFIMHIVILVFVLFNVPKLKQDHLTEPNQPFGKAFNTFLLVIRHKYLLNNYGKLRFPAFSVFPILFIAQLKFIYYKLSDFFTIKNSSVEDIISFV